MRLGLQLYDRKRWTAEDDATLAESIGSVSIRYLARKLGRSVIAVQSRAERLQLSRRSGYGYSLADLAQALGAPRGRVEGWARRGLLGKLTECAGGVRVDDAAVTQFIRRYPGEYDLRRVDQVWFKAMVCGEVGGPKR